MYTTLVELDHLPGSCPQASPTRTPLQKSPTSILRPLVLLVPFFQEPTTMIFLQDYPTNIFPPLVSCKQPLSTSLQPAFLLQKSVSKILYLMGSQHQPVVSMDTYYTQKALYSRQPVSSLALK